MPSLNDIIANFELIDDWEERYRYLIELGRDLPAFPDNARTEHNRVKGCASQVWLLTRIEHQTPPVLQIEGDSDAHIVKGLVALIVAAYHGQTFDTIQTLPIFDLFQKLGLSDHLTPQRSNGVRAMVERIKADVQNMPSF